jgi:hypothetical protein
MLARSPERNSSNRNNRLSVPLHHIADLSSNPSSEGKRAIEPYFGIPFDPPGASVTMHDPATVDNMNPTFLAGVEVQVLVSLPAQSRSSLLY